MPYIGSSASPLPVNFAAVQAQSFNGTGSQTAFTLSRTVPSAASIEVLVNNVQQSPYDDSYSVSGTTLTFSEAPSSGTNNVYVVYRDQSLGSLVDTGAVRKTDDVGAALIPVGTTAQRPAGSPGMIRHNSTTGEPEWYDTASGTWVAFRNAPTYQVEYLVIAGGGGGGGATRGGGGGAGGYRSSVVGESSGGGAGAEVPFVALAGSAYTVTVGAGGASGPYDASNGAAGGQLGGNSVFATVTSVGGGGGGASDGTSGVNVVPKSGGSGGGGWYLQGAGAAGTSGQGFSGGTAGTSSPYGGGGGGAGGAGGNFNSGSGGFGGVGVRSSINGTATFRAGGGSSSEYQANSGYLGGNGGGGVGRNAIGTTVGIAPSNGTANTGSGGGASGNGGSGIVIIRYLGAQRGTGGTVTSAGGYTIHTFTSSGTFTA